MFDCTWNKPQTSSCHHLSSYNTIKLPSKTSPAALPWPEFNKDGNTTENLAGSYLDYLTGECRHSAVLHYGIYNIEHGPEKVKERPKRGSS